MLPHVIAYALALAALAVALVATAAAEPPPPEMVEFSWWKLGTDLWWHFWHLLGFTFIGLLITGIIRYFMRINRYTQPVLSSSADELRDGLRDWRRWRSLQLARLARDEGTGLVTVEPHPHEGRIVLAAAIDVGLSGLGVAIMVAAMVLVVD